MGLALRATGLRWVLRLARFLDRRPRPADELGTNKIQRILAISCTALGDTLLSTPGIMALRQAYPHAHITLLVHPSLLALFTGLPGVDAYVAYAGKWRGFWATVRRLRAQGRYDLAAIFHGNEPQATPLAYLAGARHIVKLPNNNANRFLLSNQQPIQTWDDFGHGIEQRLAVAELAGARNAHHFPRTMSVPLHAEGAAALQQALHTKGWDDALIIALQPGASTNSRRWAKGRFVALAQQLLQQLAPPFTAARPLRFVITGSPAEQALCQEIAQGINANTLDAAGQTLAWASAGELPLLALPALLQRASVLVTGDTGPMHLAVTVNTPVVALFAVSDYTRSGPAYALAQHRIIQKTRTCDPCLSKRCPYAEPICMEAISVTEVAAAVLSILQTQPIAPASAQKVCP